MHKHILYIIMEMNLEYPRPIRKRRRSRLEPILLLSFIICLFIGLGALATGIWLNNSAPLRVTQSTISTIRVSRIKPRLALQQLAGDPATPLAYQALEAGELETTLSIISFDPQIEGRERASLYHRLARRTEEMNIEYESIPLYETMRSIAVLDPSLTTTERLQLLIGSAQGLLAAEQLESALDSAQQAKLVATQAPDMLPALRSRYFQTLLPLARKLDDELFLQQIEEFDRNPFVTPSGQVLPLKLNQLGAPIQYPPEVTDAINVRQQASRQLIARLTDDPQSLTAAQSNRLPEQQALSNALFQEDAARTAHFQAAMGGALSLQQQFTLLEERQRWLALKIRTAQRGFGLPFVTAWEGEQPRILEELSGVTQNIGPAIEALMNLEALPQTKSALRVEKLMHLALQAELGLYPNAPISQFRTDIRFAQEEAQKQGVSLALPVYFDTTRTPAGYRIVDATEQ